LLGVAKLMTRPILLDSRPRRATHASIRSNVLIAKVTTRWTLTTVPSGNTTSTRNGSPKNTLNSRKPGKTQFVQM